MRHEHGFHRDTPVDEAQSAFLDRVVPIDRSESIELRSGRGRIIAESLTADRDVPHYDRAAMDGWAVQAADTHGASRRTPRELEVISEGPVQAGSASRVHTGSPLPAGADAVVMIEDSVTHDERIEVFTAVAEGRHVGASGEDIATGETVLEGGTVLTPSAMALLRSLEIDTIDVLERPTVAVIPTGEELVTADPAPGEVIETNGLMVANYIESWGGDAHYREIVTDEFDALAEAIEADTDADLIVTTGGSSVGERDLLPEVLEAIGELVIHGVAVQPGHPVGLGVVDDTPLVMLPGYPVSCVVNTHLFVKPALRRLGRRPDHPPPTIECELTKKITSKVGRRTITRVYLEHDASGYSATPAMTSGAGILSSMAQTDAVVVVPEQLEGYDRGETVTAELWEA